MNKSSTREAIHAHGVLLVFADGTELSVNFIYQTRMDAEVLHYRWDAGEATMLNLTTGI